MKKLTKDGLFTKAFQRHMDKIDTACMEWGMTKKEAYRISHHFYYPKKGERLTYEFLSGEEKEIHGQLTYINGVNPNMAFDILCSIVDNKRKQELLELKAMPVMKSFWHCDSYEKEKEFKKFNASPLIEVEQLVRMFKLKAAERKKRRRYETGFNKQNQPNF
tara:strand:+ start:471 stop:956 length:486 start_codon:yes stop_codon:yes gene_type:complete